MEEEQLSLQEVLDLVNELKPSWAMPQDAQGMHHRGGKGFVRESIFAFHKGCGLWIALLAECDVFAYKEVSPDWIHYFGDLLMDADMLFVEYDRHHRIREWAVFEEYEVPGA